MIKSLCATGHRYSLPDESRHGIRSACLDFIIRAHMYGEVNTFYTGMAIGFDQDFALSVIRARLMGCAIFLVAALPFKNQTALWTTAQKEVFDGILDQCDSTVIVCEGGYRGKQDNYKYDLRNRWMVDMSDSVLAFWNGSPGGTANCVRYAESKGKKVANLSPTSS